MKKLLLILLCLPMIGFGQIQKVEKTTTNVGSVVGLDINKIDTPNNVEYEVIFRNLKYVEINVISKFTFFETGSDFENLYSMIIDGYSFENTKVLYKHALNYKIYNEVTIDIGSNRTVSLLYGKKGFAPISFKFLYKDELGIESWSYWLSKKQINKLFGKTL